jgi:hypothetical protein
MDENCVAEPGYGEMRRGIPLILLLCAQLASGCANRSDSVSFSIPREEFLRTARTIVLAPVSGPPGIEVAESLLTQIDSMIEETLLGAGYFCVPRGAYDEAWDRIVVQMGGLYDSVTGEFDEMRFEVAHEQLRRDLFDMHHPDYLLYPEVWVVQASHSGGVAEWDGTSQPVVGFGWRVLDVIGALLNQTEGFLEPGVVDAISLGVVVENMDGVEILRSAGGIEVLKEKTLDPPALYEPILTDPERNQEAVRTALLPLLEGR